MPKYYVEIEATNSVGFNIEADDEADAEQQALDEFTTEHSTYNCDVEVTSIVKLGEE